MRAVPERLLHVCKATQSASTGRSKQTEVQASKQSMPVVLTFRQFSIAWPAKLGTAAA